MMPDTQISDNGFLPLIKRLSNDNLVVIWNERSTLGDYSTYLQVFDSNGNNLGTRAKVNDSVLFYLETYTYPTSIAILNNGNFAVIWEKSLQLFGSNGSKLGAVISADDYVDLSAVALNNGNLAMLYNGSDGIYMQMLDSNGNKLGSQKQVNTINVSSGFSPAIVLNNGNFVVTWYSYGQDGGVSSGIYLQIFDSDGNKLGAETHVNSYIINNNPISISFLPSGYAIPSSLTLIALNNNNFVVIWPNYMQDGSGNGVYMQLFNSNGNKLGVETQVNSYIVGNQEDISAIALNNGNFVVIWQSSGQDDGRSDGVYMQLFDSSGNKLGVETQVNSYITGYQGSISATTLNNGNFVVTWQSQGQDGDILGVYLQIFDVNGNKIGTETRVGSYNIDYQYQQSIVALDNGDFIVSWNNGGISAQRFDAQANEIPFIIPTSSTTISPTSTISSSITPRPTTTPSISSTSSPSSSQSNSITSSLITTTTPSSTITESIAYIKSSTQTPSITTTEPNTSSPSPNLAITLENADQTLVFNQIDAQIIFTKNITIGSINPDDQFLVTMTLKKKDESGAEIIINDQSQLAIQQESFDEHGIGSQFTNGILTVTGNSSQVNSFLTNLKIDIGRGFIDLKDDFNQIFFVDIVVEGQAYNQIKTGRIIADYQCLELPSELIRIIEDQRTEADKALVMDFVRYFSDPNDRRFETAIHNLTQILDDTTINNPDRILDINKLNQTAFSIYGRDIDNIELDFQTTGYCQETINRDFKLTSDKSESSSTFNPWIIAGIGGGVLLFISLACLIYKKYINSISRIAVASPLHHDKSKPAIIDLEMAQANDQKSVFKSPAKQNKKYRRSVDSVKPITDTEYQFRMNRYITDITDSSSDTTAASSSISDSASNYTIITPDIEGLLGIDFQARNKIILLIEGIKASNEAIFLSYCWIDDDSTVVLVDQIEKLLVANKIKTYRDQNKTKPSESGLDKMKTNLSQFMSNAKGAIFIPFVNKGYLESPNCMLEVSYALKSYKEKIFPIVFASNQEERNIFKFENKKIYIKYWADKKNAAKESILEFKKASAPTKSLDSDYKKITLAIEAIDSFLLLISEETVIVTQKLDADNIVKLLEAIIRYIDIDKSKIKPSSQLRSPSIIEGSRVYL